VVDDVEHRHGENRRDVEPDGDVESVLVAAGKRPEKVNRKDDPNECDGDVDWPNEFGVFLTACEAQRQRDGGGDNDQLPAPEVQLREEVAGEAGLHEPLRRVVDARKHHVAHEGEDDGVGVQWAQPPKGEPRQVEVEPPEIELRGHEDADQHAHRPPNHTGEDELPDDLVVILNG